MNSIGSSLKKYIQRKGMKIGAVAEEMNINPKTFSGKLIRDVISAQELIQLSVLLDFSLEEIKDELLDEKGAGRARRSSSGRTSGNWAR